MAVLPCVEATRCLFRTRGFPPQEVVQLDEVFGMQISHGALRQKTLRVDVCHTSTSGHEECLVCVKYSVKEQSIPFLSHNNKACFSSSFELYLKVHGWF